MKPKQEKRGSDSFRRQVKSKLALDGDTIAALAKRVKRHPNTISIALRTPERFPILVAEIKADLFPNQ